MPAKIYTVYKGTYEDREKVFGAIDSESGQTYVIEQLP
jgi:hypothetical protein